MPSRSKVPVVAGEPALVPQDVSAAAVNASPNAIRSIRRIAIFYLHQMRWRQRGRRRPLRKRGKHAQLSAMCGALVRTYRFGARHPRCDL